MKLLTLLAGQTSQEVLQIETPCAGFLFQAYSALSDYQIEVVKVTREGSKTIIPRMRVDQAAAMGVADGYEILPSETTGDSEISCFIPLLSDGALSVDGGYLTLRITKASNAIGYVYALESIGKTSNSYNYEYIYLNANSPKELNVIEAQGLILDMENLTSVELRFKSGERVKYDREEAKYLMSVVAEKIAYTGMGIFGGEAFGAINIANVVDVVITSYNASSVVLVK